MRPQQVLLGAVVIALAAPLAGHAQDRTQQTTTTTTTTVTRSDDSFYEDRNQWLTSGFVGSSFGQDADDPSVDFGGTIGYLWRGVFGGEFQANFAPQFELPPARRALLLGEKPWINSYMANAIAAIPVGTESRFQPYVSGGLGVLTLQSDVLPGQSGVDPDDSRFGGNIGAGVMAFWGPAGIRGDVRYFGGFDKDVNPEDELPERIGTQVLSNLNFWRANIGVAFRW